MTDRARGEEQAVGGEQAALSSFSDADDDTDDMTGAQMTVFTDEVGESLAALEEAIVGECEMDADVWSELSHEAQIALVSSRVDAVREKYEHRTRPGYGFE